MTFSRYKWNFLPLRLNKILQHSTLWMSHAGIVKATRWIYRHESWREALWATVHAGVSHGSLCLLCIGTSQGFREVSTGATKSFAALFSCLRAGYLPLQQAATRLLHLIVSSAHSRWEGPTSQDRAPRQWYTCSAAAGVAALFFSTLPEELVVVEEQE